MKKMAWSVLALAVVVASSEVAQAATGPRVLPVGDSITWGMTVPTDTPGGYRTNFYQTMVAQNANFQFVGSFAENPSATLTAAGQTAHEGHGGWTVATDVYSAMNNFNYHIDEWMQNSNPDVVTILGGVNDLLLLQGALGNSSSVSASRTANSMDLMLSKIFTAKPNVQVFLSNLIPTAGTRSGYNSTVLLYNSALQNTLVPKYQNLGYNIHFVDQYSNFTTSGGAVDGTHLSDGLHPDATGYNLMGATFGNAVAPVSKTLNLRAAPIIVDVGGTAGWNRKDTLNGQDIRINGTWTNNMSALVGTDGTSSNYGFNWVSYSPQYLNSSAAGFPSGAVATMFPDDAARNYWGAPATSGGTALSFVFQLTGLTPGTLYLLDLYGGHAGGTDVTRFTAVGANTIWGDLTTGNNSSNILALTGLLPDANGKLTVTVNAAPGSSAFFFNSFQLNEVAVPEPASLGLLAVGALALIRRRK